jgi:hypothetical protein
MKDFNGIEAEEIECKNKKHTPKMILIMSVLLIGFPILNTHGKTLNGGEWAMISLGVTGCLIAALLYLRRGAKR